VSTCRLVAILLFGVDATNGPHTKKNHPPQRRLPQRKGGGGRKPNFLEKEKRSLTHRRRLPDSSKGMSDFQREEEKREEP